MSDADLKSKRDSAAPVSSDSARQQTARDVIAREAEAIAQVAGHLGPAFDQAVELILHATGRVIVTGMGKSGLIGRKVAATLSSTGTPAFFLHPVEAGHGDLGVVGAGDVVVAISKSAASAEIGELLPAFKRLGTPIILITGNPAGELTQRADVVLDASVACEAGPHDLVPTCSTTAALVMGDAIAVTLLSERGFTPEQFARFHPKGALGRRLLLTVGGLMHTGSSVPLAAESASFKELLLEMTRKRVGASGIVDAEGRLIGVFTDGDLRRAVEQRKDLFGQCASDVMTPRPKTIAASELAVSALRQMEEWKITVLFVTDPDSRPVGVLHMHDILSAGVT